jgi:hypothetical protein
VVGRFLFEWFTNASDLNIPLAKRAITRQIFQRAARPSPTAAAPEWRERVQSRPRVFRRAKIPTLNQNRLTQIPFRRIQPKLVYRCHRTARLPRLHLRLACQHRLKLVNKAKGILPHRLHASTIRTLRISGNNLHHPAFATSPSLSRAATYRSYRTSRARPLPIRADRRLHLIHLKGLLSNPPLSIRRACVASRGEQVQAQVEWIDLRVQVLFPVSPRQQKLASAKRAIPLSSRAL